MRWVLLVLVATVGCTALADVFGPDIPSGAERFTPDTVYLRWWKETERCSGQRGRMGRVRWFRYPDMDTIPRLANETQEAAARWVWPHDIYIAGRVLRESTYVRHEVLHDLLGVGGHPSEYFVTRCGTLVSH